MDAQSGVALVTGASRGIGREAALKLAQSGFKVAALARNEKDLRQLADAQSDIAPVAVDVTDYDAVRATFEKIRGELGPVDLLVNNAGYGVRGAVEDAPLDQVRQLFELNFFAALNMIKFVLPEMRARRNGRIVNVSSVVGRFAPPFNGVYAASKFALEGISDALRVEVRPFNIKVVLIEPGPVDTDFAGVARDKSHDVLSDRSSAYARAYEAMMSSTGKLNSSAATAEGVAELILKAAVAENPKARYPIHPVAHIVPKVQAIVPNKAFDYLIAKLMHVED